MTEENAPAALIWGLGLTQIVGYGTLYYSFGVLAPEMATDFGISQDLVFGLLSVALLFAGMLAPKAGRWADTHGAGRLMVPGTVAAALALVAASLSSNVWLFSISLVAMQLASAFVLYSTAFVAIVQIGRTGGQRSIVHLTLIAGFASTIFWPLTAALQEWMDWRGAYVVFALMNLILCLPIHLWVAGMARSQRKWAGSVAAPAPEDDVTPAPNGIFLIMLAGFALEGFVLAAILVHMVPLLGAIGAGSIGLLISTLFGPAQVASRLLNMVFGGRLSQTMLALISAGLLASGAAALLSAAPSTPGLAIFAILFGLGSGLASIVGGTLPLELFGKAGYGGRLGWITAARQIASALAPFLFAVMMERLSAHGAIGVAILAALASLLCFASIAVWKVRRHPPAATSVAP